MDRHLHHHSCPQEFLDQLCAFNLYTSHGLEMACSVYPEQRAFILAHKDETLEEVRRAHYQELEKEPPPPAEPTTGEGHVVLAEGN